MVHFNEDPDNAMQIEVAEDDSSVFDCSEIYFGALTRLTLAVFYLRD